MRMKVFTHYDDTDENDNDHKENTEEQDQKKGGRDREVKVERVPTHSFRVTSVLSCF